MTKAPSTKEKRSVAAKRGHGRNGAPTRTKAGGDASGKAGDDKTADHKAVPVVGIGASAGGLEALSRFFDAMPADSGCAFVVVVHLDPTHESNMAHLLSGHTTMPVAEISDGMPIEANHVYVIIPDTYLSVANGKLHLYEPTEERGHRHPVDALFRSLADDQCECAVAIILSGTGTNGTDGLKDVRSAGGMILVQSPDTAKFDGMPRSAIAADLADHVVSPEDMPEKIVRFLRHDYVVAPDDVEGQTTNGATLEKVLEVLHARTRTDFRGYKRSTLGRRVHRRLGLRNMDALDDYIVDLRNNPDEMAALVKDLMINVTRFFRDDDAWASLGKHAIAPLVAARENGSTMRVWVPGCSTGEEAYSMAMAITREAEAKGKQFDLKVFATDAQEDNLRKAREGVYPQAAIAHVSSDDRRRFFDRLDGSYQVKKGLRDMVMFAQQNLLRDPPFSRMDLISCRNLLIYLEAKAQERVIALCHFALRESGLLFLGNAETIGRYDDLFETISKKFRLYRRIGPTRHDIIDFPLLGDTVKPHEADGPESSSEQTQAASEAARRALVDAYAPASVLIDRKGRVLYFHGDTGDYLKQPTGEPTKDIHAMARDGLGTKLRAAIREAATHGQRVTVDTHVREGKKNHPLALSVTPLSAISGDSRMLVSFERPRTAETQPEMRRETGAHSDDLSALQDELNATRAELQNTIEEMETSNEELKASNEEVTSMNEELQSTNEELETSKEELQSFNEELQTVNSQLQHKIKELEDKTNDLDNLLAGNKIATLFLDTHLKIKWFTPQTVELFDLQSSDIGRPIGHFARKFNDDNLVPNAEEVLSKLTVINVEVQSMAGRWYMRRILPYRTGDNRIDGVVITFTDITELKQRNQAIDARRYAEAIVETIRQPFLVLNSDLRVQSASRAFYQTFHVAREETENQLVYELGNGQWNIPELRRLLTETLSRKREFADMEIEHDFPEIGHRYMFVNGRKLQLDEGGDELILLAIEDFTERKIFVHQQTLVGELNHRVKNVLAVVQAVASQTLSTASSLESAREAFGARLIAMANAHDVLTSENWSGADLFTLVQKVITPYTAGGNRFDVNGPHVRLLPGLAMSFAMAMHELCTNAVKYGALSVDGGHIEIHWQFKGAGDNKRLQFRWAEHNGPPVTPPTRKGFGSRLIERSLAMELNAKVNVAYNMTGVVCTIDAPMPADSEKA